MRSLWASEVIIEEMNEQMDKDLLAITEKLQGHGGRSRDDSELALAVTEIDGDLAVVFPKHRDIPRTS